MLTQTSAHDVSISLTIGAHSSIGMKGILLYGTDEQKARYLPKLASGEYIAAFCLTESGCGLRRGRDPHRGEAERRRQLDAQRREDLDHQRRHRPVLHGVRAHRRHRGQDHRVHRRGGWPGVSHGRHEDKMGIRASSTTTVGFSDVRVPAENVLGGEGKGFKVAMGILNNGRTGLGGGAVGGMKTLIRRSHRAGHGAQAVRRPIASSAWCARRSRR